MKIVIIGGGIGGLATALALHRQGVAAHVYERADALREVGAGISLWSNATHVLQQLGLLAEASAASARVLQIHLKNPAGQTLNITRVEQYEPPMLGIHRADLLTLLHRDLPAEQVILNHTFARFEPHGQRLRVHFTNGATDECDVLIGADGLKSRVREQIIGDGEPRYSGYPVWRGLVEMQRDIVPPGQPSETLGAGARFGIFPLGKGRIYWYATANLPEGQSEPPAGRKQQLLSLFQNWHAPIAELIAATQEGAILRNDCYDRKPTRGWSRDKAVLIGDAAHPTTPNMGQGGCMALEDALVLSKLLAANPSDIAGTLKQFEQLRFARTAKIIRLSRMFGTIGQWDSKLGVAWRERMFRLTPARVMEMQLKSVYEYQA
ncbi:MAG TPA: FAD-dependent monooxygenase [Blastocatellia bacterium]|nr:FAD-dependent monooxygenase [Blastocatellia bacterium]